MGGGVGSGGSGEGPGVGDGGCGSGAGPGGAGDGGAGAGAGGVGVGTPGTVTRAGLPRSPLKATEAPGGAPRSMRRRVCASVGRVEGIRDATRLLSPSPADPKPTGSS